MVSKARGVGVGVGVVTSARGGSGGRLRFGTGGIQYAPARGGDFWSPSGRPHKAAEVARAGVPLLNGFVGVWWHRASPPFWRRGE